MHERYRRQTTDRQTDGRAITYSEREREFTFGKKGFSDKRFVQNFPVQRHRAVAALNVFCANVRALMLEQEKNPWKQNGV